MAEAWFDLPFYYVFNGEGLVDGTRYDGLSIAVQDDAEFRLRAIHGVSSVGRLMSLVDQHGKQVLRGPSVEISLPLLIPEELVYEPGSQIRFGVSNVLRSSGGYSNSQREYRAKIVFAGVKRFRGPAAEQLQGLHYPASMLKYQRRYYCWSHTFTVDWFGKEPPNYLQPVPPRVIQFEVDNRGLEVYAWQLAVGNGSGGLVNGSQIEIMPYEISGRALASDYVPADVLNYAPGAEENLFPAVPLYWPPQSMVRFGVRSVMTDVSAPFPLTVNLTMFGARRIPC